ncbi:MurR/RpiR family transcriptional regulator [Microbacterium oryzae]|uniref:MurR/RpiR family transcriptional regulator n=1 Tax=Microbacterium oryzae TaxID=743009 RepID=UPI0025AFE750|nr:MurR/RpiR family transcriptional regulator [Microbacterium oryzae]MDN3310306.1 MurR/RpiR family transcriptional regulator [Microbacterium oryzae]
MSARVLSLLPSLQRTEQRVAEAVVADPGGTVERTAQELADAIGVGRTTVVRTAQSLGYDGYPQLRVAVAQELALRRSAPAPQGAEDSPVGEIRAFAARFSANLGHSMSALTDEAVAAFLETLDEAERVLVVGNGLSGPLGLDLMLRLNAAGRPAEQLMDPVAQQISARQLGSASACVAISGSGASRATVVSMRAARDSGARVLAVTSFARSPVADAADVVLVIPPANDSFHDELIHTSRAALMLVNEQLVDLLIARRGGRGQDARAASLSVLGGSLQE